jgi:hypothetical protein
MMCVRPGGIVTLVCAVTSCGTAEITVLSTDAEGGATAADAGAQSMDGGSTPTSYCAEESPALLVSTAASATPVCAGQIAQSAFRYALCTCGDLVLDHALTTDAFDGSHGPYSMATATVGGSVGANGNLQMGAAIDIGGSLWTGGMAQGFTSSFDVNIGGELHAAGLVDLTGPGLTVDTDAWAASGLVVTGSALIAGTLFIPQGAPLNVGGTKTIGATVTEPVHVPLPCDCARGSLVDVGGFVETYRANNDDTRAGLDELMLENVQTPLSMTIPCGRLFFTRVGAHAPVHLTVVGRTAMFVGGDFQADADFFIDVPSGSELNLFIEGNVVASQGFGIGDQSNPARARVYIGGNGDVVLQNASSVTGNLYAPSAQLVLGTAATTIFGSAFVRQLGSGNGALTIHFDESVARESSICKTPTTCSSCRDCGNQACTGSTCAGCSDSSQCCTPLVCRSGTCVLDVR